MLKWIIQKTLAGNKTLRQLIEAIEHNYGKYELIEVIPFEPKIKYIQKDNSKPIIYGSSTFMFGSLNHPYLKNGVFYNPNTFSMRQYFHFWKEHMLNYDGIIIKAFQITELDYKHTDQLFVRPDNDSKSFSGFVYEFGNLCKRISRLDGSNPYLDAHSEILLAPTKDIEKEWRNFIVCGKVIASSRYRVFGELLIDANDIPNEMIQFSEKMCFQFTPHDVFVMDVAYYQGEYKIIECNCFNGSGTYQHNLNKIIGAVQDYRCSIR